MRNYLALLSLAALLAGAATVKAADAKPADAKPVDAKPVDAKPAPVALGVYFNEERVYAPADEEAFADLKALLGREAKLYMNYQGWTGEWNGFSRRLGDNAARHGGVFMVVWEPWQGKNPDADWSCKSIAQGKQDDYVRRYAREVKGWNQPVMLRFAHEMNGAWYPWGTAFPKGSNADGAGRDARNNGNTPSDYVAMWRHVWGIFHEERAENVFWVWSPNLLFINEANSRGQAELDYAALFPGDDYVDWIGLDGYNNGEKDRWRTFGELFGPSYEAITRLSRKPLMLAEFGCTERGAPEGTSKAAWITQSLMHDIPERFPRIKLVNWFSRDKSGQGESNWRFNSSPQSLEAFRDAVNSPLYQGQIELKH